MDTSFERHYFINMWNLLSISKSMVFMSGPRQAGKTTLAMRLLHDFPNQTSLNWDIPRQRAKFLDNIYFFEQLDRVDNSQPLVVFDEIHKYDDWKNYLKGIYDEHNKDYRFLVTGSGRLDLFQKGGDSLAGRYFLFHLWPLSISEFASERQSMDSFLSNPLQYEIKHATELHEVWEGLSELSPFPEPYLSQRQQHYQIWTNTYTQQLVRQDIRDAANIRMLDTLEDFYYLLPTKAGSPLSIHSLSHQLKASHTTLHDWIELCDRFFLTFRLSPWTSQIAKSLQKEKKAYLFNYPLIEDPGARFETMVAAELWFAVHRWTEQGLGAFALHYVRNRNQQEVDFLITNHRKPLLLIETKLSNTEPSKSLQTFQAQLNVPAIQLHKEGNTFQLLKNKHGSILKTAAAPWLAQLP